MRLSCFFALVLAASAFAAAEDSLFVPAPESPIKTGGSPGSADVGDVNGDGALDLVVSNLKLGHAEVYLGDNTGKFRHAEGTFPNNSGTLRLLDANEDGHPDVAAIDDGGYGVEIFLGDGKGGFVRAPGSPFQTRIGNQSHPRGLAVADVNEDGHADVFITNNFDNDVSGVLGDGKSKFTALPAPIPVGQEPFNIEILDVNGDRHVDICTPTPGGNVMQISIAYGDGAGHFTKGFPFVVPEDANWVAFGDVNGDGRVDLAANQAEFPFFLVALGDGQGRFNPAPGSPFQLTSAPYASHVEMGDANGDGRKDLFLATGESIEVYLANEKGGFAAAPGSPYATGPGAWHVVTGDWNKDGKCDVAASSFEGGIVTILLAR